MSVEDSDVPVLNLRILRLFPPNAKDDEDHVDRFTKEDEETLKLLRDFEKISRERNDETETKYFKHYFAHLDEFPDISKHNVLVNGHHRLEYAQSPPDHVLAGASTHVLDFLKYISRRVSGFVASCFSRCKNKKSDDVYKCKHCGDSGECNLTLSDAHYKFILSSRLKTSSMDTNAGMTTLPTSPLTPAHGLDETSRLLRSRSFGGGGLNPGFDSDEDSINSLMVHHHSPHMANDSEGSHSEEESLPDQPEVAPTVTTDGTQ
eukprot:216493_1